MEIRLLAMERDGPPDGGSIRRWALIALTALVPLAAWSPQTAQAQTCSCAGTPLTAAQGTGAGAGQWLIGVTAEHHEISRVFTGSTRVGDETARWTRTLLFEIHYGLSDRVNLSATWAYAGKERATGVGTSVSGTTLRTDGPGDALFMVRYTLLKPHLFNRFHLAAGVGAKAPVGRSSLSVGGHPLNADMQPGTGSWDGLLTLDGGISFPRIGADLVLSTSYRRAGTNERFDAQDQYRFGHDTAAAAGAAFRLSGDRIGAAVMLQFRHATHDRRNEAEVFNTGGRWLYLNPSVQAGLGGRLAVRSSGRMPLTQHLNGTQPSTSFSASLSLFLTLGSQENEITTF